MYGLVRTDDEIYDVLNACTEAENEGRTKFRGMTYEQGVKYAIWWLTDSGNKSPLSD